MHDVICVNVFPPQVNGIPPQRTGVTGASPTTSVNNGANYDQQIYQRKMYGI